MAPCNLLQPVLGSPSCWWESPAGSALSGLPQPRCCARRWQAAQQRQRRRRSSCGSSSSSCSDVSTVPCRCVQSMAHAEVAGLLLERLWLASVTRVPGGTGQHENTIALRRDSAPTAWPAFSSCRS